jgi:hypothetical protein
MADRLDRGDSERCGKRIVEVDVSRLRRSGFFCMVPSPQRAGLISAAPPALRFLRLEEKDVVAFGVVEDGPGWAMVAG